MAAHVNSEEFKQLENRVDGHDVQLAVQGNNLTALTERVREVVDELTKTRWTLVGFAVSVVAAEVIGKL